MESPNSNEEAVANAHVRRIFREFVEYLVSYDSDTFNGKGANLTVVEATLIIVKLLEREKERIDGVTIDALLDEIRESTNRCPECGGNEKANIHYEQCTKVE